jgi:hypothetical protein
MNQAVRSIPAELWAEYGNLQSKANRARLDSYSWAIEDQLNHFLDSIEGRLPENSEARSQALRDLLLNRTKKHSRRCRLLEARFRHTGAEPCPEDIALRNLEIRETVARVRSGSSPQEWRILCLVAGGSDYETVAEAESVSISALKAKIHRHRTRLRRLAA